MLCLSTPAAPSLAQTFSQAASSVAGANTLSIKLNQRPPLTPLTSANTIRSVHTQASIQLLFVSLRISPPCVAPAGTFGVVCAFVSVIAHHLPTPLPRRGFATHAFHREIGQSRQQYYEGSESSRTSPVRKASPVHLSCRPSIQSPKHVAQLYVTFPYHPRAHNRFLAVPGFAVTPRARRYAPPKRVCYPAGCSFALRLLPTPPWDAIH